MISGILLCTLQAVCIRHCDFLFGGGLNASTHQSLGAAEP